MAEIGNSDDMPLFVMPDGEESEEEGDPNLLEMDDTETEDDVPPQLTWSPDSPNLAYDFGQSDEGREFLKKVSDQVITDFDDAWEGSEDRREKFRAYWDMYCGDMPEKTFPWKNCANVHVPISTEVINRLALRIYSEVFGDWSSVFNVVALGPEDQKIAEALTAHGNWQIREQIPDFKAQAYRGVVAHVFTGDWTYHCFYDPVLRMNRAALLGPDELVTPFVQNASMPDWSDVPYLVKVLNMRPQELEARRDDWEKIDKVLSTEEDMEDTPDSPSAESSSRRDGVDMPGKDTSAKVHKVLWYEGWMRLPNADTDTFVKAMVHYSTGTVLSLVVHEEDDWQDRVRYRDQSAELDGWRQGIAAYQAASEQRAVQEQAALAQHEQAVSIHTSEAAAQVGMGMADPASAHQFLDSMAPQLPPELPPLPEPPKWLQGQDPATAEPEKPRKVPIRMFVHGRCHEPAAGPYGIGYGGQAFAFNAAADTLLNQFTDAATMGNCKPFVAKENVEFTEPFEVAPGKLLKYRGSVNDDIKNDIMPLDIGQANPQLFQLVELMGKAAEGMAQAPDVLSGESGKSGETYRGLNARIEQATKQLSVIASKFLDSFVGVLKNLARLNAMFMRDEELVHVTDPITKSSAPIEISREWYERSYNITIRADLRFTTQAQKVQEADGILAFVMGLPMLAQNLALVHSCVRKCFEARKLYELIPFLGPPPPMPTTPFGLLEQGALAPPGLAPVAEGGSGAPKPPGGDAGSGPPAGDTGAR